MKHERRNDPLRKDRFPKGPQTQEDVDKYLKEIKDLRRRLDVAEEMTTEKAVFFGFLALASALLGLGAGISISENSNARRQEARSKLLFSDF